MKQILICFLLFTGACDYTQYHNLPTAGGPNQGQGAADGICTPGAPIAGPLEGVVTFAQVQAEVFQPRCFSCHGNGAAAGGVNLSTYASAKAWASLIKSDVVNNIMPKAPNPPLSQAEKDIVVAWVDAGAPNTLDGSGSVNCKEETPNPADDTDTTPVPPVDEFLTEVPPDHEINYTLVREKIFKFRCLACHSTAGGNADGLNLETYFNTVDEVEDIYEEVAEQNMPPFPRPPLNDIERKTLLRWIELGSPK